jgi:cobaltochelatase CobT
MRIVWFLVGLMALIGLVIVYRWSNTTPTARAASPAKPTASTVPPPTGPPLPPSGPPVSPTPKPDSWWPWWAEVKVPWQADRSVLENPEVFGYSIYTTAFDQVVDAATLATPAEFATLAPVLAAQLNTNDLVSARGTLTSALTAAMPRHDPCAVTVLADHSGSLRGEPARLMADLVGTVAAALDASYVPFEVLGFTTVAWKGGRSREQWLADGKPERPGRLNDLRHIVYKSFEQSWSLVGHHLSLLVREENGLLKENLDGEAVAWAYERLALQPQQRRVLIVVSDGAPVDDSTLSVNGSALLEYHLRHAIDEIQTRGVVDLMAIGIGHDVSRYYARTAVVTSAADLLVLLREGLPAMLQPPLAEANTTAGQKTIT